jgi:hypothetical protein
VNHEEPATIESQSDHSQDGDACNAELYYDTAALVPTELAKEGKTPGLLFCHCIVLDSLIDRRANRWPPRRRIKIPAMTSPQSPIFFTRLSAGINGTKATAPRLVTTMLHLPAPL